MTSFFLIRHASCCGLGQTLWGRTSGVCLNDKGQLQAQLMADRFAGITLEAVYSSPLERALQTADVLARSMNLKLKKSAALNEIDYGDWTGQTFDELSHDQRWRRFNSHRSVRTIPGGESFLEVQNRVVKEIETLSEHQRIEISPCSVSVVSVD